MFRRLAAVLILVSAAFSQAPPQLTIDALAHNAIAGPPPENLEWSPDGSKLTFIQRNASGHGELWYVDVATGKKAVLVDETKLRSLAPPTSKIANERQREWRRRYGVAAYHWDPNSKALLFDSNGQLWYYKLDSGIGVQITSSPDLSSDPKFSPNGKKLAYVRNHELWVRDMPDGQEQQITKTPKDEHLLNGEVDWVYAEELDVRSNYFWSPDNKQIAYLQMDEGPVPEYPIVDFSQVHAKADMERYPQPGDPNPVVRVGVIGSGGGNTKWVDLPMAKDDYIPRFGWVRPGLLWIQVLNRDQNKLVLYLAEANSGKAYPVLTETSNVWVNVTNDFHLFKDGNRFLWSSWRDGHTQLYLYSLDPDHPAAEAKLLNQVTKGDFEVTGLDGVNEAAGLVYFTANPDPRQRQLFSVHLDGTNMQQLSKEPGTHAISFGPDAKHYVDRFSALYTPPGYSLCNTAESCSPFSESKDVSAYHFEPPQWLELTAADGKTKLYGQLFLPPNPPAGTKIPVILHPYGGPSGQSVVDSWIGGGLFQVYLARKGFAVLVVDNRGMANRGRDFNAFLKGKFGPVELSDQLAALDQVLLKYPQLDGTRVGIYGASYGGYMVLYSMTHTDRLKAGVSIAPVSNWRLYDSIYTERYLGLPAKNEAGYNSSSPTNDGEKLSGALRIVHGTSDDNVHMQNTVQMAEALIKAGKPFDIMLYPNKTHGISGPDALSHLYHSLEAHFMKYLMTTGGQAQ
jgi:dipeptidyl-peptidase-4